MPKNLKTPIKNMSDAQLISHLSLDTKHQARSKTDKLRRAADAKSITLGKRCTQVTSCHRLSCYFCRAQNRIEMIRRYGDPLTTVWEKKSTLLTNVTIVPEFGMTAVGSEPAGGLKSFKAKVRRKIKEVAPDAHSAFFLDISLNVALDGKEHWQWHLHGVMHGLSEAEKTALSESLKWMGSDDVTPMFCTSVYYPVGLVSYFTKPNFKRRNSIIPTNNRNGIRKLDRNRAIGTACLRLGR